jgi:murein DD-endopeptidase MepM/ murein hydrolase activator NlpD
VFGGLELNDTPVYAAYPGYLTRLPEWKSSLIIRIPDDPLHPGTQIWTYYTHMASQDGESFISADFPPGAYEVYVYANQLLGYQGNYSGEPGNPVGVHLHFSIVKDDGTGHFLNELEFDNTLDPSPYLGLPLNANENRDQVPVCP